MEGIYSIPERFFGLFQSQNRYIYIETLLLLYEEYLYNDYFLTKDTCIQMIQDHFSKRIVDVSADVIEEEESGSLEKEPVATKILNRLLSFGWLKKIEDYQNFRTNILIPEYAFAFIEVLDGMEHPKEEETTLYIQNVYATIYSFYYDKKAGIELLGTAKANISRLNRSLQELLHNMDQFFETLLKQKSYEALLNQHLAIFVEDSVNKKYALLKTNDNFYIYKNDIKTLLEKIRSDEARMLALKDKLMASGKEELSASQEIEEVLDAIGRGITNMEKRIAYIDNEYTKYVKATVNRLEYLLSQKDNAKGMLVELLHALAKDSKGSLLTRVQEQMNYHDLTIVSNRSFYQKKQRRTFEENVTVPAPEEAPKELTKEEILRMNKMDTRYQTKEIDAFVWERLKDGCYTTSEESVTGKRDFELLILAYDHALRKNSPYFAEVLEEETITHAGFTYPKITFRKKGKTKWNITDS
ncbi:MAG: hypothetical protein PWP24_1398 [Clostridiales bacterium]|nr:hypothetical protein [Clostridiales bacterium]